MQLPTPIVLQPPTPIILLLLIASIPQQAAPLVVPITVLTATPITTPAAPTAPATPPGPQSSNYDQLLQSRE